MIIMIISGIITFLIFKFLYNYIKKHDEWGARDQFGHIL